MPPAHSSHRSGDTPASPDADPERAGRFTRTQRLLLGLAAGLGVATLAGISFVLSYDDLRALAMEGRAAERWAPAYPVMVDALVVVTILSLVVARHARWWNRWPRWILLLLLLAGSAAASVQRALKGFGPLPDEPLKAGVAVAPYVLLALATLLWLAMFRQMQAAHAARPSRRQRRAAARQGNAGQEEERLPERQPIAVTGAAPTLELPAAGGHARALTAGGVAAPSPEMLPLGAAVAALDAAAPAERTAERGNAPGTADHGWEREPEHDLVPGLRPVRSREEQATWERTADDQARTPVGRSEITKGPENPHRTGDPERPADPPAEPPAEPPVVPAVVPAMAPEPRWEPPGEPEPQRETERDTEREQAETPDATRVEGHDTAQAPPALDELPPFPAARHIEQPWEAAPPPAPVGSAARPGPDRTDAWLDTDEPDSSEPYEPDEPNEQLRDGAGHERSEHGRGPEPAVPATETVPDLDVRNEVAAAAEATTGREAPESPAGSGFGNVPGEPEMSREPAAPSEQEAPREPDVPRAPTSLPTDVRLVGRSTPKPDFAATTQPDMVIPPSFAQDEEEDGDSAGPAADRAEDPDAGTTGSPAAGPLVAPSEGSPGRRPADGEPSDSEPADSVRPGDERTANVGGGTDGPDPASSRPGGAAPMDVDTERTGEGTEHRGEGEGAERTGEQAGGQEGDDGEQWSAFGAEDAHLFTEEHGLATGRADGLFDGEADDLDWTPPSSKFRSSPTPPRER